MTTDIQRTQDLYFNQLKPTAIRTARNYIMARTPHDLQNEMGDIVDADIPPTDVPMVVDAPFISQTGTGVGSVLNCTLGNWTGVPTTRTYIWKRGVSTVGATPSYTVTAPDIGTTFTCVMIASNIAGLSQPSTSNAIVIA